MLKRSDTKSRRRRLRGKLLLTLLPFVITIFFFLFSSSSRATISDPIIELEDLAGVHRIFYGVELGPHVVDEMVEYQINFDDLLSQVLKEDFEQAGLTLQVSNPKEIPIADWKHSEILFVSIGYSVSQDTINSELVTLASMALTLSRNGPEELPLQHGIRTPSVTYAFIVPNNSEEIATKFKAGVKYLTSFLPSYIECANTQAKAQRCNKIAEPYVGVKKRVRQ